MSKSIEELQRELLEMQIGEIDRRRSVERGEVAAFIRRNNLSLASGDRVGPASPETRAEEAAFRAQRIAQIRAKCR